MYAVVRTMNLTLPKNLIDGLGFDGNANNRPSYLAQAFMYKFRMSNDHNYKYHTQKATIVVYSFLYSLTVIEL